MYQRYILVAHASLRISNLHENTILKRISYLIHAIQSHFTVVSKQKQKVRRTLGRYWLCASSLEEERCSYAAKDCPKDAYECGCCPGLSRDEGCSRPCRWVLLRSNQSLFCQDAILRTWVYAILGALVELILRKGCTIAAEILSRCLRDRSHSNCSKKCRHHAYNHEGWLVHTT